MFNDTSADIDFRVEGNGDANALFVEGETDHVGIGSNNPTAKLDVIDSGDADKQIIFSNNATYYGSIGHNAGSGANVYVTEANGHHKFLQGSTELLRIASTGAVTMSLQPSFQGGITSLHSTGTLKAGYAYHNQGSHYNTSTGLFTAPVTGKYLCGLMVMSNSDSTMDVGLTINGSVSNIFVPYTNAAGSQHNQISGICIAAVSANDTLGFNINTGTGYGVTNGRHSSITFHLIA